MTTFTTEDRQNASPPHIVDTGASYIPLIDKKWLENKISEMPESPTNDELLEFIYKVLEKVNNSDTAWIIKKYEEK